MSWFGDNDDKKNDEEKKDPMSKRFFTACLLILVGVIALWMALQLLAQFWGWIVLIGAIVLAGWIVYKVLQARRDRW